MIALRGLRGFDYLSYFGQDQRFSAPMENYRPLGEAEGLSLSRPGELARPCDVCKIIHSHGNTDSLSHWAVWRGPYIRIASDLGLSRIAGAKLRTSKGLEQPLQP
jgi:hypothetical protein